MFLKYVALIKQEDIQIVTLESREVFCLQFIPSVLVLELETSRHIIKIGIYQDTTGKGAMMDQLSFPARSSHVGRLPHRGLPAFPIHFPNKEISVICQSGTFHKHKIHMKIRD